jgi:cytochrome P450
MAAKSETERPAGQRAANPTHTPDVLNLLLKAQQDGSITPERVRSEATVNMLAGHETTATTMSFMWHLLSQNHWARDKMLEEVDTVLEGRTPNHAGPVQPAVGRGLRPSCHPLRAAER